MTAQAAETSTSKPPPHLPSAGVAEEAAAEVRAAAARMPFADEGPSRRGGRWRVGFYGVGIVALAGAGLYGWQQRGQWLGRLGWLDGAKEARLDAARYHTVVRGDLRVVLNESGQLRSVKNHAIYPKIERQQLTITWLADEGTAVKAGDLVASFDPKQFEDQLRGVQAELGAALREQEVAKAAVEIEVSNGKSMIAQAESKVEDAHVALRTYMDLEAPKRLNDLDAQINELRQKTEEAEKLVQQAKSQLDDGLFNEESQRQQFEQQYKGAIENHRTLQKQHDAAKLQRKIFRAYEYPQTLNNREQEVSNANLDLAKAEVNAENGLNQKRAELAQANEKIQRLERDEERLKGWIENCDLKAPVNGLVVYGDGRNYYGSGALQVGGMWFSNNPLMTIPDLSSFEIDVLVAEQYRGLIAPGLPVSVDIQALPGTRLAGKVKEISRMGQPRSPYDPAGPRAYRTAVTIDSSNDKLVSGMTALVEILADEVRDVLLVPLDAVYNDGGTSVVFLRTHEGVRKQPVEVGRRNMHVVEIVEGLEEGDQVSVAPSSELLEQLKAGGLVEPEGEAEPPVEAEAAQQAAASAPPSEPPQSPPPAPAGVTGQ